MLTSETMDPVFSLMLLSPQELEKKYGVGVTVAIIFGVVFLCFAMLFIVLMAISRAVHRRRKLRRQAWGEKYGLRLLDTLEMSKGLVHHADSEIGAKLPLDYPYVPLFQNKKLPMSMHILEGLIDGRLTRTFEFKHTTGSGKSTVEHHFTVMAFHFDAVKPYTAITRHGWGDGLTKEDIKTRRTDFDDAFYISSDEWGLLQNEMPDDIAQTILESRLRQFVVAGQTLVVIANGRLKDKQYDRMLEESRRLANWFASKR